MRVAASSFGGPAAQIAVIHRVAVDEKKWLDEAAFVERVTRQQEKGYLLACLEAEGQIRAVAGYRLSEGSLEPWRGRHRMC